MVAHGAMKLRGEPTCMKTGRTNPAALAGNKDAAAALPTLLASPGFPPIIRVISKLSN